MENEVPENPFLHVGMLSHEQHLGLFSISWSMEEAPLIVQINDLPHFH